MGNNNKQFVVPHFNSLMNIFIAYYKNIKSIFILDSDNTTIFLVLLENHLSVLRCFQEIWPCFW